MKPDNLTEMAARDVGGTENNISKVKEYVIEEIVDHPKGDGG